MCVMSPFAKTASITLCPKCSPVSIFKRNHLVPVFNRNLSLSMNDPQTKFEVNWSKHSQIIVQKPFSDCAIWWHQAAPSGASFRKEPSSVHQWATDQIWSKSVEAFSSYSTETIFRWCHLVSPGGTTWCQFSTETFLCPWVIHRPNLKWIGQRVRVIARKPFSDGATWWHQAAPPGASFRKESSSAHEWCTDQIWRESV